MASKPRKDKEKDKEKTGRLVWRMSKAAPLGEYVDPALGKPKPEEASTAPPSDGEQTPPPERGWHRSSHELVQGVDMREEPLDTLPDELFDLFIKKP